MHQLAEHYCDRSTLLQLKYETSLRRAEITLGINVFKKFVPD